MRVLLDGQTFRTPEACRGIGVATRMVVEHAVRYDSTKEWCVSVCNEADLASFHPEIRGRLTPIELPECSAEGGFEVATRRYTSLLQEAVSHYRIDAYWNPNPLMINVLLAGRLENVTSFATVYDLIPWVMRDQYLDRWPRNLQQEYLRRLKVLPTCIDHLIFPSESSREDYIELDESVADKSSVVFLAADHTRFAPLNGSPLRHREPFVLYTGGFDPRKNMQGALEAFARLVKKDPKQFGHLKLCIVCSAAPEDVAPLEQRARELGIADRLVMTGYVSDAQLASLYQRASVFFFPSQYEGFGLPVLEAMACGTPVVTSETSSLPQVAGTHAYYCSPDDARDMADALRRALTDPEVDERCSTALDYAQEFTWSNTAAEYSRIFVDIHIEQATENSKRRPRVAYVTPWPPQRTGVAHYAQEMASYLSEYADLTLYVEDPSDVAPPLHGMQARSLTNLPAEAEQYDTILYHIGNNTQFHRAIYQLAWEIPGVVDLHDYNLNPFLADAFLGTEQDYLYYAAALEAYGITRDSIPSQGLDTFEFPMSLALAKRSHATIVHSSWVRDQLCDASNVHVVPHGSENHSLKQRPIDVEPLRQRLDIDAKEFVVLSPGFVHRLKRIDVVLKAVKALVDRGIPVRFVIAGAIVEPSLGIEEQVRELGLESCVTISGYLSEEDLDAAIALSDVVVNLRCPSLGESSGTLLRAFSQGKACIVSNYQQYAELPNDVCWKADTDELEVPQLVAYLERLIRDPVTRQQLGQNANAFVHRNSSFDFAAKLYAHAVNSAGRPELRHAPEVIANQLHFDRDWQAASEAVVAAVEPAVAPVAMPAVVVPRRSLTIRAAKWCARPAWRVFKRLLRPLVARFDHHMALLFSQVLHERMDHRVAQLSHLVAVRDEMMTHVGTLNSNLHSVQLKLSSSAMTREIDDRLDDALRDIAMLRHQVESLRESVELMSLPAEPINRGNRRKDRPYLSRGRRANRDAA